jgi:DNA-binding SARP family transcriptional activator
VTSRSFDVELQLLDGFELRCDGTSVRLPMSAQRLVAFLALRSRPALRAQVAGTLWADSPEERAFASLRSALWRVHQTAGQLVDSSHGELRLHPGMRVDFARGSALAHALIVGSPVDDDVPDWRVLLGDLLPDWHDDWLLVEREHYRDLGLQALEALAEQLLRAGRPGQALQVARAAVAREPLRESSHRLVVRSHVACGNWFEAIRQYRFFRHLLRSQLGLFPSGLMEDLVGGLLADDRAATVATLPFFG